MWSPSRAAKERIAKRRRGTGASINMWPFASVMMALLFLFIGALPPIHHRAWGYVDLPFSGNGSSEPKALREDSILIEVSRDGAIFFRNIRVGQEELVDQVRAAVREGAEPKVYLAADARTKYADVKTVIQLIGQAGIRDVTILTEGGRTNSATR